MNGKTRNVERRACMRALAGIQLTRRALAREDRTGRRGPWLRALDRAGIGFAS